MIDLKNLKFLVKLKSHYLLKLWQSTGTLKHGPISKIMTFFSMNLPDPIWISNFWNFGTTSAHPPWIHFKGYFKVLSFSCFFLFYFFFLQLPNPRMQLCKARQEVLNTWSWKASAFFASFEWLDNAKSNTNMICTSAKKQQISWVLWVWLKKCAHHTLLKFTIILAGNPFWI